MKRLLILGLLAGIAGCGNSVSLQTETACEGFDPAMADSLRQMVRTSRDTGFSEYETATAMTRVIAEDWDTWMSEIEGAMGRDISPAEELEVRSAFTNCMLAVVEEVYP